MQRLTYIAYALKSTITNVTYCMIFGLRPSLRLSSTMVLSFGLGLEIERQFSVELRGVEIKGFSNISI